MKIAVALLLLFSLLLTVHAQAATVLSAELKEDALVIQADGKLLTAYTFSAKQKYPWFYPVNAPGSDTPVTTESSEPYPHHHSLFFGCDKVNGGNYWQDVNARGQILSQGPELVKKDDGSVAFTDTCLWKRPEKDAVLRDRRRVSITAPSEKLYFIDFEITLEPLTDIHIEKTNHSLFSARMRPELSVESGGVITNAQGGKNSEQCHGAVSEWCDYSGAMDGAAMGMAIFQHPDNEGYPSRFFTRDYGFFSPTPLNWLEDGFDIPKDKPLTLKYRVVVHRGDVKEAGIADLFQDWIGEK